LANKQRGTPRVLRVHQRDGPYKTIESALAEVRDGDIVEIADSGTYIPKRNFTLAPGDGVLACPVDFLTIRAGKDASPLVLLRDEVQEGVATNQGLWSGWLVFVIAQNRTALQIDGLHFRLIPSAAQIQRTAMALQSIGLIRISNCSFSVPLPTPAHYIYGVPAVVWLENNAYRNSAAKNEGELVRLDTSPHFDQATVLCAFRNCLFNGNAFAHRSGNAGRRLKIHLALHGNTCLGRVAEMTQMGTLAAHASENLVVSPEAVFKFDDDAVWRSAMKEGDRNALWIAGLALTEQQRTEFSNVLLPGPALKTRPTFETTATARDPLRLFHLRRSTVNAADGSPVGVRFEYLPDMPPEG
jgi:hypothetical protein